MTPQVKRLLRLIHNIEVQLRNYRLSGHAREVLVTMDAEYRRQLGLLGGPHACRTQIDTESP